MTASQALTVYDMAKSGVGYEDICVKLQIDRNSPDGREVRKYVLGLGSKVAQRYGS